MMQLIDCYVHPLQRAFFYRKVGLAGIFLLLISLAAQAQPCANNSFTIRQAVCAGTVAWLQGSTPTGGSGSPSYQWQMNTSSCGNGGFSDIPNANGKDYMVPAATPVGTCFRRVVNPSGCNNISSSEKIDAIDRTVPVAPTTAVIQPTCVLGTGTITVTSPTLTTGATGFSISGPTSVTNTTGIFPNLPPGTYTVTAEFPTGCSSPAATVVLSVPTLSGSVSPATGSFCAGGSQTLSVTGPAGASYQWYRDNSLINGATGSTFSANQAGTYTVEIILGSCRNYALGSSVVTVINATGTLSPATATVCGGGGVTLTATGGTSYKWYKDNVLQSGATSSTFTATSAGVYSADIVIGTCSTRTNNAVVTVGSAPTGTISPATSTICPGGAQTLTATGGGTYQWSRNGTAINGATSATYVANQAGTYTVEITNGTCTGLAQNNAVVTVAALPTGNITPASASICVGSSQTLTATGGANYQWYKDDIAITGAVSATFNATQAGTYTVDIINSAGCKAKASNSATITVTPLPTGSISPATATICAGSSVTLTATGGANYQWYKDGSTVNNAFGATFTANQPGTYAVDIFDAGGCKGKSSNESVVTITTAPSGPITPANVTLCPGGSATLTASGGTTYQWFKDNGPITGATSATLTVNAAGTYRADIFAGTCKGSSSNTAVVTIGANPTGPITPAAASLCSSGGSVTLTASGGTSYQWALNGSPIAGATGAVLNASQAGTYTVAIFNGSCSGTGSNNAVVSPATPITFNTAVTNPSCTSTSGTVTVSGVTGGSGSGYTYSSNNGASYQPGNTFVNLAPGTYQVVVKDAGGCRSDAKSVTVTAFVSNLAATVTNTAISCTQPTSTVTVTTSGGTTPYQYSLDGGAFQSSNSFASVGAGSHRVTTKDATGCLVETNFTITAFNSTLTATATPLAATCSQPNGSVSVQASGGTAPYTYAVDGGTYQTSSTFNNLTVGQHKVTVKDNVGCTFEVSFNITQASGTPNLLVTNPPRLCPDDFADLTLPAVIAGSDPNLVRTYWMDAAATQALANPLRVGPGTFYIKATNGSGCSVVKPVTVSSHTVTPGVIFTNLQVACLGDTISLASTPGLSYQWLRNDTLLAGATNVVYRAAVSGNYRVRISDGNCTVPSSNTVSLKFNLCLPDATAYVPTAFTPNRNGTNDVLRPILYHVTTLKYFKVYNRWGKEVFQTNVIGRGWDGTINGTPQPAEAYSWIFECVGKDGNVIKQSGRSLLIR